MPSHRLAVALGGRGGLRERFRREPLLAALGLLSGYGFAFIPVDVVWHAVVGPDLTAESPPRPRWRGLLDRPRVADAVALGIVVVLALDWLQLLTTGWEWADPATTSGPGWTYPVTVLAIGDGEGGAVWYARRG